MIKKLISLFILTGCVTTGQVRREQKVDNLNQQVSQTQRLSADLSVKIQQLEQQINGLQGGLEEKKHAEDQEKLQKIQKLSERFTLIEEGQEGLEKQLQEIKEELRAQKEFIAKVTSTLEKMTSKKAPVSKSKKKVSSNILNRYERAVDLYNKKNYAMAYTNLLELKEHKKLNGSRKARILHHLGMIEYQKGRYQKAMTYFGQLYSRYQRSRYIPNGLLHLGLAFRNNKQENEAKDSFRELINKYPKSTQANMARSILKKMK